MTSLGLKQPGGPRGISHFPALFSDPLKFIVGLRQKHGPVAQFRLGPVRYVVLSRPEHVQQVLRDKVEQYSKRTFDYKLMQRVMGESLLTGEGSFWQQRRKLIQPAFQRKQLGHLAEQTRFSVQALAEKWQEARRQGAVLDIAAEMMELTLRIIGRTLFSTDLIDDAREVGLAIGLVNAAGGFSNEAILAQIPLVNYRYRRALAKLEGLVYSLIAARRRNGAAPEDLLTSLMLARDEETGQALSDREVRNEVLTLLLAGHETTAAHLAWTWHLLGNHPELEYSLREELHRELQGRPPELADLSRLPFLQTVHEESMRLYPPVWAIPRLAEQEDVIDGFVIPRGANVLVVPYLIHREPDVWEEPAAFRPERFDRSTGRERTPGAYIPFGAGPRYCIGAQFAMAEAQLVLGTLVQQFSLEPMRAIVEPQGMITLRPRGGLPMRLRLSLDAR